MMNKKAQIEIIRNGEKELSTIRNRVEERNRQNANMIKAEALYLKKVKQSQDKHNRRKFLERQLDTLAQKEASKIAVLQNHINKQ